MASKVKARALRDERELVSISFSDPSLAVQASKDECDINWIVNRYLKTGVLPEVRQGAYLDISEMVDLRDALHMVDAAQAAFMELPADVRRYFDNDPVKLVEFAQDANNYDKAVELGLATPRQPVVEPDPKGEAKPSGVAGSTPVGGNP